MSLERAAGSLKDSIELCRPVEIKGSYSKGKSVNAAEFYVTVEVNVTKVGLYKIATDLVNGFSFADSGIFKNKGLQKIQLKATGVPLVNTPTIFNCFFDTSYCAFVVDVTDLPTTPPVANADTLELNSWRFFDSTDYTFHHGKIDRTSTWFTIKPGENYLNIIGWPSTSLGITKDTLFIIEMFFPQPSIDTGTYTISSGVGTAHSFAYSNNKEIPGVGGNSYFFYYRSTMYTTPAFHFRILSYDPVLKRVKGSFEGSSKRRKEYSDYVGALHQIKGEFYFEL